MKINVLPPKIYNRIAAGEVVEKPASIVKEVVENSLDAGATKIKVEIKNGGISEIIVTDNGCGIAKEDLPLAFLPHATSKIVDIDDLDAIATLGFRGEALASISAVSQVKLSTKTKDGDTGYALEANGGEISKITEVARTDGTTIKISNIFYNTPARAKFLRKPKSEEADITHLMEKFMLANPNINFQYYVDDKLIYNANTGNLKDVIYLIYGREVYDNLLEVSSCEDKIAVTGFVAGPKLSRPNRTWQTLFVNGRYVENYQISACVQGCFEPLLMKGRFPIYVLNINLPYDSVDVNVHPNKREVKFANSSQVFMVVRRAVEKALISTNLIADFEFNNKQEKEWEKFSIQNDREPARTSFDAAQKTRIEPLSHDEGASYRKKIDVGDVKIPTMYELKKQDVEIVNMPEFSKIKSEDRKKNKPGGNIFFDHSGERLLSEVDLSVPPKMDVSDAQKNIEEKSEESFSEQNFLSASVEEEIRIVGVIFKTYILTEYKDSVFVIDQHAMHERQLYDKLKREIENGNVSRQDLLIPYTFSLTTADCEIFNARLEQLKKIGFEIANNGQDYVINAVPFLLSNINLSKFVEDILSDELLREKTASGLCNEKLCQTACKHAIRAGDDVSRGEIAYLIEQMQKGVLLCPHGRPIVVKITKKDFEKMFKRVL